MKLAQGKLRLLKRFVWRKEQQPDEYFERKRSQEIEEFIKHSDTTLEFKVWCIQRSVHTHEHVPRVPQVLLLGSGESGKSTILKQLRTIYRVTFSPEELNQIACSMHVNALQSMQVRPDNDGGCNLLTTFLCRY